jgi:hypothetical protein
MFSDVPGMEKISTQAFQKVRDVKDRLEGKFRNGGLDQSRPAATTQSRQQSSPSQNLGEEIFKVFVETFWNALSFIWIILFAVFSTTVAEPSILQDFLI